MLGLVYTSMYFVLLLLFVEYIRRLQLPSLFETYRSEYGFYRLGSGHENDGTTEEKENDAARLLVWSMFAKLKIPGTSTSTSSRIPYSSYIII